MKTDNENVKKVGWDEVCKAMLNHATKVHYGAHDENPVRAVVVFDPEKSEWKHKKDGYSLADCSYEVSSVDKYWHSECGGNSLYAYCLDKNSYDHQGIRLDYYLGDWKVDYCYFVDKDGKAIAA